jgi:hypothetical protein
MHAGAMADEQAALVIGGELGHAAIEVHATR